MTEIFIHSVPHGASSARVLAIRY